MTPETSKLPHGTGRRAHLEALEKQKAQQKNQLELRPIMPRESVTARKVREMYDILFETRDKSAENRIICRLASKHRAEIVLPRGILKPESYESREFVRTLAQIDDVLTRVCTWGCGETIAVFSIRAPHARIARPYVYCPLCKKFGRVAQIRFV